MKKYIVLLFLFFFASGTVIGYRMLTKAHRNIAEEVPVFELNATGLAELFNSGNSEQVMDKTVVVSGVISEIGPSYLLVENGVQCSFPENSINLRTGDTVKIKGRCIGYDDLFDLVKLDQCSLISYMP